MKKMLEYQKLDIELSKLYKMKSKNDNNATLTKLKAYIIDFQNKAYKLEEGAEGLVAEYEKLKSQYQNNVDKIQKLTNTNIKDVTLDDVEGILEQINSLSGELYMLDRSINSILEKIRTSLKNFEIVKKNRNTAKTKYNECKAVCEKNEQQLEPKIAEIEKKMKAMEKDLNPELFAKYKELKADNVIPVFVPVENKHCSRCRVELPTAKLNKLKAEGTIVCECHSIIFDN